MFGRTMLFAWWGVRVFRNFGGEENDDRVVGWERGWVEGGRGVPGVDDAMIITMEWWGGVGGKDYNVNGNYVMFDVRGTVFESGIASLIWYGRFQVATYF